MNHYIKRKWPLKKSDLKPVAAAPADGTASTATAKVGAAAADGTNAVPGDSNIRKILFSYRNSKSHSGIDSV